MIIEMDEKNLSYLIDALKDSLLESQKRIDSLKKTDDGWYNDFLYRMLNDKIALNEKTLSILNDAYYKQRKI